MSSEEQTDAFNVLSDLMDDYSNEGLLRLPPVIETFSFVSNQQIYQMGTGAPDFNTARPMRIDQVNWGLTGPAPQTQNAIQIITEQEWMDIKVKTVTSSIPLKVFIQDTYPYVTLNFWPMPNLANQVVISSQKAFATFSSVNSTLALPPGYQKMIRYNLAIDLAPEYGITPAEAVIAMAVESKANIKRTNTKPYLMKCDSAIAARNSGFNWITGE